MFTYLQLNKTIKINVFIKLKLNNYRFNNKLYLYINKLLVKLLSHILENFFISIIL